jgi:DNA mismatch endonuclease (patch repair protein)
MIDVVDKVTRSRMMSGIQGKNTKPELLVRKYLHGRGLRFRLHAKELPGKPDLVFPKYKAVVFVHGCFWHGHDCPLFKWPTSNALFWRNKIERNRAKDMEVLAALRKAGWRVMVIWECTLKGKVEIDRLSQTIDSVSYWLVRSKSSFKEISGA